MSSKIKGEPEILLTQSEAAKVLGISVRSLQNRETAFAETDNPLPVKRDPSKRKSWGVTRSDLEAWDQRRRDAEEAEAQARAEQSQGLFGSLPEFAHTKDPAERKKALEAALLEDKLRVQRRSLVPLDEHNRMIAKLVRTCNETAETLLADLERAAGKDFEKFTVQRDAVDDFRRKLADAWAAIARGENDDA